MADKYRKAAIKSMFFAGMLLLEIYGSENALCNDA